MPLHHLMPQPLALVMVGKPARGKSFTARKLARYLRWMGYQARVFNVGSYRRHLLGTGQDHTFFDPENEEGLSARRDMAEAALNDLTKWIRDGGEVGLYDATNSTRHRRRWVTEHLENAGIRVVFIELICEDPALIAANIRETKVSSPDYREYTPDEAIKDFEARISHYDDVYETLEDPNARYIKLVDAGRQVVANRIEGYLSGRLVQFLLNTHLQPRSIYLTRHGESEFNLAGRIGGDSGLAPNGQSYAESLAAFMEAEVPESPLTVWTSTLKRTRQTAAHLPQTSTPWRILDEIDAGICDGMTYEEIEIRWPDEFAARREDKLTYRYPRGESYEDVIARVGPVIIELERQKGPVLVVAHQAILRALYAYFTNEPRRNVPHLSIPLHTIIKLTPRAYGCEEERMPLPPAPDAPSTAGVS